MLFIIKSINRELKTRPIYDCRCDERLEPKYDEFTYLTYTVFLEELEYLKIKTRLIDEKRENADAQAALTDSMG
jgi:hypothetical protein